MLKDQFTQPWKVSFDIFRVIKDPKYVHVKAPFKCDTTTSMADYGTLGPFHDIPIPWGGLQYPYERYQYQQSLNNFLDYKK